MSDGKVERLLDDWRLTHASLHPVAEAVRAAVHVVAPDATERVMYGGLLFGAPNLFCGVFVYTAHVTMEFGRGAELRDPHRVLEGGGKFRRHIKLRTLDDIATRHLRDYIEQALHLPDAPST